MNLFLINWVSEIWVQWGLYFMLCRIQWFQFWNILEVLERVLIMRITSGGNTYRSPQIDSKVVLIQWSNSITWTIWFWRWLINEKVIIQPDPMQLSKRDITIVLKNHPKSKKLRVVHAKTILFLKSMSERVGSDIEWL